MLICCVVMLMWMYCDVDVLCHNVDVFVMLMCCDVDVLDVLY